MIPWPAVALAVEVGDLEVDPPLSVDEWEQLGAAPLGAAAAGCEGPWHRVGAGPVACVTLAEVADALNLRSARDGFDPAFSVSSTEIRLDPTADGWRLPTCGEALRLWGPEDRAGGRWVGLDARGDLAWCTEEPRFTPSAVPRDDALSITRWSTKTKRETREVHALATPLAAVDRRADTRIRPVRRVEPPATPTDLAAIPPPRAPVPGLLRWGQVLVFGWELDAATWAAAGGPAWTDVDGACAAGAGPGDLPARCVSPREAIAVLNALSARDGLTPAYTAGDGGFRLEVLADGWRLPACHEARALRPEPSPPCPKGANLGGDLPWDHRSWGPTGASYCAPDGDAGPAPAAQDDGRFGNVSEIAWCSPDEIGPLWGLAPTARLLRIGPSYRSAEATSAEAPMGLDDRAPDVGLRPVRTIRPWPLHTYTIYGIMAGAVLGLALMPRWSWRGVVGAAAITAVGVTGLHLWPGPPAYVLVDVPMPGFDVVRRYDLVADDAAALSKLAIAAECANHDDPRQARACAAWDADVSFRTHAVPEGCAVRDATARLHTRLIAPRAWLPAGDAALAFQWRDHLEALLLHEEGHRLNGVRAAEAIERELPDLPVKPDCAAAKSAAEAHAAAIVERSREADKRFDRRAHKRHTVPRLERD